jgi:hypothetical protein
MNIFKKTLLVTTSLILLTASNSFWTDRNLQSTSSGTGNVVQDNPTFQPTITPNASNKLPGMVFDGTDDFFNFISGSDLTNKGFTVMVVEQRADDSADNYFVGSDAGGGLLLGYKADNTIVFGVNGTEFDIGVEPFSEAKTVVHVFTHDPATGKRYYRNGSLVFSSLDTTNLTNYVSPTIGKDNTNYYNGTILEMAMYSRDLSVTEIAILEDYFFKKWSSIESQRFAIGNGCTDQSLGFGLIATNAEVNGASTVASGGVIDIECSSGFTGTPGDLGCSNGVLSGGGGSCVVAASDCDENSPGFVDPTTLDDFGVWATGPSSTYTSGTILDGNSLIFYCSGGPPPIYTPANGTASDLDCSGGTWTGGAITSGFAICTL